MKHHFAVILVLLGMVNAEAMLRSGDGTPQRAQGLVLARCR